MTVNLSGRIRKKIGNGVEFFSNVHLGDSWYSMILVDIFLSWMNSWYCFHALDK